jgi:hydrogenase maturation protease
MGLLDLEPTAERAPLLVIGVGNPGRGDDAIGPRLIQRLRAELADRRTLSRRCETLDTYQLQPEHALDLRGRERVFVIDAVEASAAPFAVARVTPAPTPDISTHRLSPAALAGVYRELFGAAPCMLVLAICGERFGLGEALSTNAEANLDAAFRWLCRELYSTWRERRDGSQGGSCALSGKA